jgi:hypothetical protein
MDWFGGNGAIHGAAIATSIQKPTMVQPITATLLRPICRSDANRAVADGSNSTASIMSLTWPASSD